MDSCALSPMASLLKHAVNNFHKISVIVANFSVFGAIVAHVLYQEASYF